MRTPIPLAGKLVTLLALTILGACSHSVVPTTQLAQKEPGDDPLYRASVTKLAELAKRAGELNREGKADQASPLVEQGEKEALRLLAVRHPTLEAMEAASDLDDLYGRMLFQNRHYGWARLQFQKNVARWKHWRPQTAESGKRLAAAQAAIGDCDRRIDSER